MEIWKSHHRSIGTFIFLDNLDDQRRFVRFRIFSSNGLRRSLQ